MLGFHTHVLRTYTGSVLFNAFTTRFYLLSVVGGLSGICTGQLMLTVLPGYELLRLMFAFALCAVRPERFIRPGKYGEHRCAAGGGSVEFALCIIVGWKLLNTLELKIVISSIFKNISLIEDLFWKVFLKTPTNCDIHKFLNLYRSWRFSEGV